MRFHRGRVGILESFLSIFLLAVLVLIGIGVFLKQFRYNRDAFAVQGIMPKAANATDKSLHLDLAAPADYTASPKMEAFDADSLYVKIDGKDDLYLRSGFKQLYCRVFKSNDDPNLSMEICVYDMGAPENALAVFGQQRRPEGEELDIPDFSYKTPDAVFLAKGKYYVEITGSTAAEPLVKAMETLGRNFASSVANEAGQIEELSLFPKENLIPQSFKLYISGAYGFDGFKEVYSAGYVINGSHITAFICKTSDAAAAEKLANGYRKFLVDNGAAAKTAANAVLKGDVFDMSGETEIVFAKGAFVGGIHAAEKQDVAEAAALKLLDSLSK
jgi:hypothetical protein